MQLSFQSAVFLGLAVLSSAHAQMIWDITVGGPNGETVYNPTNIVNAQPGDQVVFHFNPKNHTVTQSSFAEPCGKLDGGFDSGFNPVPVGSPDHPTFNYTVQDSSPVWIYCRQGAGTPASHCGMGMVFAINPGADGSKNSFANFQAKALAEGAALSSSAAAGASSTIASNSSATTTYTAAYGNVTIPPPPTVVTVTETVTLDGATWTTTYGSYPGSPAATPASLNGTVHTVVVGGANLTFNPPFLKALPRDQIVFEFHQKNHTSTQSSFEAPCVHADGGFNSGFNTVADNATAFPTFNITVNDTAPIWVYCMQTTGGSHCGKGMVFAVNPVESSDRSFEAFQSLAEKVNGTGASGSAAPQATTSSASGTLSLNAQGTLGLMVVSLILGSLV